MFTKLITTAEQAAKFAHTAENRGAAFICAHCGEAIYFPIRADGGYSCGTGYARIHGDLVCYPCADKYQAESMRDASEAFGFISSDGKSLTSWSGGKLGTVVRKVATALPFGRRFSHVHGSHYYAFQVRDVHGQYWHGKSSQGVAIRLRRMKGC